MSDDQKSIYKDRRSSRGIGKNTQGIGIGLSRKERLNHTHILGSTGTGKSKFMELLLRQDLRDRKSGLCLIDPHGSLYEEIVLYASHKYPHIADRIVLFDPAGNTETIAGFNPLAHQADNLDYLLDSLIAACLKAWGQDDPDKTPRITKWLENVFYTVIANDLTLVEALPLLNVHNNDGRQALLRRVNNEAVLDDWAMFEASTQTQKQNLIEGASNRLRKFLRNEIIRNILGQQEGVLDLAEIMSQGKILLVNLNGRGRISHENTRLLGIMLVNELFRVAKLRNPRDRNLKPFFCYIDEFAQFMTRDIARALEETRKYKMFMVLAHQHLAQLRREDEYLYASVLTNCKNKVVFGGLSREDAEIMGNEIQTGFVDLKKVKNELYSTKERHIEETRTTTTRNWSKSEGSTSSSSRGYAENEGNSKLEYGYRVPTVNQGESYSKSSSEGTKYDSTEGGSESTSPFHRVEEYKELSSVTFWTVEELHYMEMAQIKNQDVGHAFVKVGSEKPQKIEVRQVSDVFYNERTSPKRMLSFQEKAFRHNKQYYLPIDQARLAYQTRQTQIFGEPLRFDDSPTLVLEHEDAAENMPAVNTDSQDDPFA